MSKKNLLGVTNSFGDYLGIAEPFTIRFRLGYQEYVSVGQSFVYDMMIFLRRREDF